MTKECYVCRAVVLIAEQKLKDAEKAKQAELLEQSGGQEELEDGVDHGD